MPPSLRTFWLRLPASISCAPSSRACACTTTELATARLLRWKSVSQPPPSLALPPVAAISAASLPASSVLPPRTVALSSHRLLAAAAPPRACTFLAQLACCMICASRNSACEASSVLAAAMPDSFALAMAP